MLRAAMTTADAVTGWDTSQAASLPWAPSQPGQRPPCCTFSHCSGHTAGDTAQRVVDLAAPFSRQLIDSGLVPVPNPAGAARP